MIFELARQFTEFTKADWAAYHPPVENLLAAHGQGWHLFSPTREVAHSLLSNCELSATQRAVMTHYVVERVPILAGQVRSAHRTILCLPDNVPLTTERTNQIPVPLKVFADLENCSPSQLLVENADADGEFLVLVSELVGRDLGYSTPLRLVLVHGGGGTIGARYKAAAKEARPTCCVVDSDVRFPGCALGSTAKQIQNLRGKEKYPTVRAFILPVRELENVVPVSVLFEVYNDNPAVRDVVARLCTYIEQHRIAGGDSALIYLDFKLGLKRSDIAKVPQPAAGVFQRFAQCVQPAEAGHEYDDEEDNYVVCAGVSANMLTQVSALLSRSGSSRRLFKHKLFASPAWAWLQDVLLDLLSYGAAGERLPVRQ